MTCGSRCPTCGAAPSGAEGSSGASVGTGWPLYPSASAREHEPRARIARDTIGTGAAEQELQREGAVRTPEAQGQKPD